ncbi:uncharacterized protein [Ptychodera flava]|uniref:uncharacterized protein n=1 Tax=Ptychodera flava TaxID=63121 RepID=UPI00396A416C
MDRFPCMILIGLAFFTYGARSQIGNDFWDGNGELLDGKHGDVPLRNIILQHFVQHRVSSPTVRSQRDQLLRQLMLFRLAGTRMGEYILRGLEKRREDERVYTFSVFDGCNCAIEYHGEDGTSKGFIYDFVDAVCEEAGKRCVVVYNPASQCYTHEGEHPHAGLGIMGRNIDICMLWMKTAQRQMSVSFTQPILKFDKPAYFVVKVNNPRQFDPTNLTGKKIGFVDGLIGDTFCLAQSKDKYSGADSLKAENIVYSTDIAELFNTLRKEEVDAVFIMDISLRNFLNGEFERIGESTVCGNENTLHGMKRKDEKLAWFEDTLSEMKLNGKYHALCHRAKREHGHKGSLQCVDS